MQPSASINVVSLPVTSSKRGKLKEDWLNELNDKDLKGKGVKWLVFCKDTGIAKCEVCASFPNFSDRNSKVVKGYAGAFKLETFRSTEYQLSMRGVLKPKKQWMNRNLHNWHSVLKMDEDTFDNLTKRFNVAYFIAKNNKPFTDFPLQIDLYEKLGENFKEEYRNRAACREFISHIASEIRKELIDELADSDYVSLLLDGSTDTGTIEELVLYVRYLKGTEMKEAYLSMVLLENGSADGYLEAIEKELEKLGVSQCLN